MGNLKSAVIAGAGLGVLVFALAGPSTATTAGQDTTSSSISDPGYTWDNVAVTGGGYVPAIIFNPSEKGLAYARTDVGGAYRLDPVNDEWIPLLDHIGWDQWGHSGVLSLATDPVEPNRVYVAVGSYTTSWDPGMGAIKRSDDYGRTWRTTDLPFKVGGNMPGRGIGERLVVDPNDNSVLYYGAEQGQGLWRSADFGESWQQVEQFPNLGHFAPDPNSEWEVDTAELGVLWTAFDPSSGAQGSGSQTLITAVADLDNPLYRSDDAGETWYRIPDAPTGYLAHHFAIDPELGRMYVTFSDTAGPYDGSDGAVWHYDIETGEWTDITPTANPLGNSFGYSGLAMDATNPQTLVVATQVQWWPDNLLYRTTDGGETWDPIWDYDYTSGDAAIATRYDQDISASPWLTFGAEPVAPAPWTEPSPKLGWMMTSVAIDPFDPDHAMYGTGATIYRTHNLTDWSVENKVHLEVGAQGIEETSVQSLAAPPVDGVGLLSAMYDVGGFVHHDIDTSPEILTSPYFGDATSVDYAEQAPQVFVRAGTDNGQARLGISRDAGNSWYASAPVDDADGPGTVAVSADGSTLLWAPDSAAAHVSTDDGATWRAVVGLPSGTRVAADRVDPETFYAVGSGVLFVSHDGGATFVNSGAEGLPDDSNVRLAATPGHRGHLWIAGGTEEGGPYGMWRSTDAGETVHQVDSLGRADTIGFGLNAEGFADYPALYSSAVLDGVRGIYRSLDEGASWHRINDDEHQWAWTGADITGDLREFGLVYIATNGRGIVRGTTEVVPEPEPAPTLTVEPTASPEPTQPIETAAPTEPGPTSSGSSAAGGPASGASSGGDSLASTGTSPASLLAIGAGVVTLGAGTLALRRRLSA